jgi:hypothetical protein
MSKGQQLSSLVVSFTLLISSLSCQSSAQSPPSVSMSGPSVKISKLEFPQPWLETREVGQRPIDFPAQIEVRKGPNSHDGELFFAALPNGDHDYSHELNKDIPAPEYSGNFFAVDFANGNRIRALTESEWSSGSRMLTKPRLIFSKGPEGSEEMEYRGKTFTKVGKHGDYGMLSPHGKWLAVFSYSGEKPPPSFFDFLGGGNPRTGDIFWTIYDTESGEKIFQGEAKDVKSPASLKGPVVWLEERYFLFPLDVHAQNFVVVTLPEFVPKRNPLAVKLPSRHDQNGRRIPGHKFHEAWTPLLPLTKEQAAKKAAPMPTELSGVRLSAAPNPPELLIEVLEETENRNRVSRHRVSPYGDGGGEYHYRVLSKYYYALSLNDPSQTRFASKEEWERSRSLRTDHTLLTLNEKVPTTWGDRPEYHPVTKRGTAWCDPKALRANEWIAAFSYTRTSRSGGEIFIDVYDKSSGFKMSSGEASFEGDANELLKKAFWIEGDYLLIPLNSSLDSFVFWTLPG